MSQWHDFQRIASALQNKRPWSEKVDWANWCFRRYWVTVQVLLFTFHTGRMWLELWRGRYFTVGTLSGSTVISTAVIYFSHSSIVTVVKKLIALWELRTLSGTPILQVEDRKLNQGISNTMQAVISATVMRTCVATHQQVREYFQEERKL